MSAPELVQAPEGGLAAGLRYFGLRLPIMLSELMPLDGTPGRTSRGGRSAAPPRAGGDLEHRRAPAAHPEDAAAGRPGAGGGQVRRRRSRGAACHHPVAAVGHRRLSPSSGRGRGRRLLLAAERRRHRTAVGGRDRGGRGARHLALPSRSGRHPDRAGGCCFGHDHSRRLAPGAGDPLHRRQPRIRAGSRRSIGPERSTSRGSSSSPGRRASWNSASLGRSSPPVAMACGRASLT